MTSPASQYSIHSFDWGGVGAGLSIIPTEKQSRDNLKYLDCRVSVKSIQGLNITVTTSEQTALVITWKTTKYHSWIFIQSSRKEEFWVGSSKRKKKSRNEQGEIRVVFLKYCSADGNLKSSMFWTRWHDHCRRERERRKVGLRTSIEAVNYSTEKKQPRSRRSLHRQTDEK